jgi:hypothetical protein
LGILFSAIVIVYILLLDKKTPRRIGNESALAFDGGINPGKKISSIKTKTLQVGYVLGRNKSPM